MNLQKKERRKDMKKLVKFVSVNDGNSKEVNNGNRLLVENYPRTEIIIKTFLDDGWTLLSLTQELYPGIQKPGAYTFYKGGVNLLFEKEVDDTAEDNGDIILKKAINESLKCES